MFQYVDVSGVGNAGKSAVVDFLREQPGFLVPKSDFEFDLFRLPGGLLDLHHHLVEDWSPIRSDRALKDFRKLIGQAGANPTGLELKGRFTMSGQRYDRRFNGQFTKLGLEYVNSFVNGTYQAYWPYDWFQYSPPKLLWKKVLLKTGSVQKVRSRVNVSSVSAAEFAERTTRFINGIFSAAAHEDTTHVVFNNAFEPYNPERCLSILSGSRSIIVYRDPRDVYVSGLSSVKVTAKDECLQGKENDGLNRTFLGADDLDSYIMRYRTLMEKMYRGSHPRVLAISFEDLVFSYQRERQRILDFLGFDRETVSSQQYFCPQKSEKNVGVWKKYSLPKEVDYIASKLPEFLWGA